MCLFRYRERAAGKAEQQSNFRAFYASFKALLRAKESRAGSRAEIRQKACKLSAAGRPHKGQAGRARAAALS